MTSDEEARRLVALYEGHERELVGLLMSQLSVLRNQAQMLMGLAGLAITVTGFSGHHMVRGGPQAWVPMVAGIGAILVAVVITIRVMLALRWVTQDLADDLILTCLAVLDRVAAQRRALAVAGGFGALGLAGYLIAVVLAAFSNGGVL